jgi:hypothetical protein
MRKWTESGNINGEVVVTAVIAIVTEPFLINVSSLYIMFFMHCSLCLNLLTYIAQKPGIVSTRFYVFSETELSYHVRID